MFTGLIQTTGVLHTPEPYRFRINWHPKTPSHVFQDIALGDSVAVDGICLTVTKILGDGFEVAVSPETLQRTTFAQGIHTAPIVNLEPSLRVGSKLGGHFVTGHIDGVGYLDSVKQTAIAWEMTFKATDRRVARYIVSKGSIAINGVSLTIAACDDTGQTFSVAVIPTTYHETNLQALSPGTPVNLEGDILGKYIEKFMGLRQEVPADKDAEALIHAGFLAEHGYL